MEQMGLIDKDIIINKEKEIKEIPVIIYMPISRELVLQYISVWGDSNTECYKKYLELLNSDDIISIVVNIPNYKNNHCQLIESLKPIIQSSTVANEEFLNTVNKLTNEKHKSYISTLVCKIVHPCIKQNVGDRLKLIECALQLI